jgi:chemotaxis regulatin CheY-phosphate phosphatase CheZ
VTTLDEQERIQKVLEALAQEKREAEEAWRNWISERLARDGNRYITDVERRFYSAIVQLEDSHDLVGG